MKWKAPVATLALVVGLSAVVPNAEANNILPLDGAWITLEEFMDVGDFFKGGDGTGYWDFSSTETVRFTITDYLVVTDWFEVYDKDLFVFATPKLPDWPALAGDAKDAPPYADDPDVALASGVFSSGEWFFAPGDHSISIKNIHIPPVDVDGFDPFLDGTVAFKAEAVPEPGSAALLGAGVLGLWFAVRRRT